MTLSKKQKKTKITPESLECISHMSLRAAMRGMHVSALKSVGGGVSLIGWMWCVGMGRDKREIEAVQISVKARDLK